MRAAEKRKPVWADAVVVLIILILAAAIPFFLPDGDGTKMTAVVSVDGEPVWSYSLNGAEEPVCYVVEGRYPLVVEVSDAGIRVVEASCPGEDCIHTGLISEPGRQIVCLPNRTIITLQGHDLSYDVMIG